MTGISSIFNEQVIETVRSIISNAVNNKMVGNGVATGGNTTDNWLETIAAVAEEIGIPFVRIAPAPEHDGLQGLFNAHQNAIGQHDGPCIVCYDASQNHELVKDIEGYVALNNAIEELLFENGQAIYVHVLASKEEPKIFISSHNQPKPHETQAKINFREPKNGL